MRSHLVLLVAALAAAFLAADASAAKGGPSPGTLLGWDGVRAPDASVRYVALAGQGTTSLAAVRVRDGRVLRYVPLEGALGVPLVAFDGTTDGLSADGRTLVLSSLGSSLAPGATSRFTVLATRSLRVKRTITLAGLWSFDALSPDGSTIYAIQYLGTDDVVQYKVRAIDVARGRPLPGAIIDRREPDEDMQGSPTTRAFGPGRTWAYTLYGKPDGTAFVHALDTRRGEAVCIELPWQSVQDALWNVRMSVTGNGQTLTLRQPKHGRLAVVHLGSGNFRVQSFRRPVAPVS
jgi:hypothetical protein